MDEDELYGDILYQDVPRSGGFTSPEASAPVTDSQLGSGATDLTLRVAQQAAQIDQLQGQLQQVQAALQEWVGAFDEERQGIFSGVVGQIHPIIVLNELRRLVATELQCREELMTLQPREAALQAALCQKTLENVDLRGQLQAAKQASDPSVVQLRQVLLDPAVNREFGRLQAEAEVKARELKIAQEELQAVQFSQESKAGRMLMAKCRALQDENEEMGRELSEGRLLHLERSLEMAREQLEELRIVYYELEDHAHSLDDENEQLQAQMLSMKRQLAQHVQQQPGQEGTKGGGEGVLPPPVDRGFGRGRGPRLGRGFARGGFFPVRAVGSGFDPRKRTRENY